MHNKAANFSAADDKKQTVMAEKDTKAKFAETTATGKCR